MGYWQYVAVTFLLPIYLLWVYYLACMAILSAHNAGRMGVGAWVFALPVVLPGVLIDCLLNYTILAVLTMDFPRKGEWTFSQRLERLVQRCDWRGAAARGVASVLNPFDSSPGGHIKAYK